MSMDTIFKLLFGSILIIISWDILRRYVKDEIDTKGTSFSKQSPMNLFAFALAIGVFVFILGIVDLVK